MRHSRETRHDPAKRHSARAETESSLGRASLRTSEIPVIRLWTEGGRARFVGWARRGSLGRKGTEWDGTEQATSDLIVDCNWRSSARHHLVHVGSGLDVLFEDHCLFGTLL